MKYLNIFSLAAILLLTSFVVKTDSNTKASGIKIGDKAPNIVLENPEGKIMKLSDLKGKLVLIDFWASWCGPCRRENPNVVRAYKKYSKAKFKNAKGFEIFSVSLDGSKGSWKAAIEADGLAWKYHVSDLKKWRSEAAALYSVGSIPASFLVNSDGIIVAKNLRGNQLDLELDKHIKSL